MTNNRENVSGAADSAAPVGAPPRRCPKHPKPRTDCAECAKLNDEYVEWGRSAITNDPEDEDDKPRSASTVLVELALKRYRLGVTDDGEVFAVATRVGSPVVRMLRGGKSGLRAELSGAYFDLMGRAAPQQALADALLVLEGKGRAAQPESVHLRIAEDDSGRTYIDMGDRTENAIRVTAKGWDVIEAAHVPVLFQRTRLTGAFPVPERGGDLSALWDVVNVAEMDRALVLGWLVAALVCPDVPHPILSLFAEQGSGKSSGTKVLVALVDPSPVPLRKPPRDPEGWVTAAAGSWVVALDNLSELSPWLSDSMCRAVTGDGDVRRALYTDGELAVFAFRRCLLVNGIDLGAMRGDYAERSLVASLERITPGRRRTESELGKLWTEEYPRILGALLDLAAGVKAALPSVRLDSSPRMADFARVLAAVDRVLGTDGLERYIDQARSLAVDSLDGEPLVVAMRERLVVEFIGTAAELLDLVRPHDEKERLPAAWPKSARAASGVIKRAAPALRVDGWSVEQIARGGRNKVLRWHITPPLRETVGESCPSCPLCPSSQVEGPELRGHSGGHDESIVPLCPPDPSRGGHCGHCENDADGQCPQDFDASTCGDGHNGHDGHEIPLSLASLCPECGFDGVPDGCDMHHDCRSKVEAAGVSG
ncbi:ATP-binding protein [Nocardia sp. CA-120079]|uniref:ATP-binding protein n=1 Tax=Nocardia sp. CA-120079 TaxID=3239974 RepID=UPI003D980B2A